MLGVHYVYATLLALASLSVTSANLNMNDICALVNDGSLIASYAACNVYYMCTGGIATMRTCSTGNYFDKEQQSCVPQEQVECLVAVKQPCDGYSVGTWAPVAGSCSGFYYCSANGPQRSNCPSGENFSPTNQSCVYNTLHPCSEATVSVSVASSGETNDVSNATDVSITIDLPINLCHSIRNGWFFGSPSSCAGWNKCLNNVATTGFCPTGYLYNVLKMECDLPTDVTCSQVTHDPYLTADTCTVVSETIAATACSSYYVCDGSYYQLAECPAGLYYDTVSKTCVNRLDARNNCDRCAGVTNSFVNMYSAQNCTGYLYCSKGVQISVGFCPTGSYFDERVGGCVETRTEPLLGCCNPAYYN